MNPHIVSSFDKDLEEINLSVLKMGGQVESAILEAARALETRDEELALTVVEGDKAIDAAEEQINNQVVRLLALRQPQAGDLRTAVAVMKTAGDLERLGDYAKNMAKRVPVLVASPMIDGAAGALRRQARLVGQMLTDMLDAFARHDTELARDVIARDIEVDDMTNALFREFITHMMEDPRNITPCLHYVFIAKNIERMGDLVTHGAENVIFVTEGETGIERDKGLSTATIDTPRD
ncbi:MAG: phosphate signaling complex protein PhoU [Rhodobacteraceae bacterium]|nr:phosphate signaling complex protein PhoU [Paracoccaceae bacterium]